MEEPDISTLFVLKIGEEVLLNKKLEILDLLLCSYALDQKLRETIRTLHSPLTL